MKARLAFLGARMIVWLGEKARAEEAASETR